MSNFDTTLCASCDYATDECMLQANKNGVCNIKKDNVSHPSHYCQPGSIECIDEMIAVFGVEAVQEFCLLNVWKYRKRALFKNGEEDIRKSDWYMKKYIELRGKTLD